MPGNVKDDRKGNMKEEAEDLQILFFLVVLLAPGPHC